MSAFFVSRQTIHDTVTAWAICHPQPRSLDVMASIGRSLWKMNAEAMRQRYPSIIGTAEDRQNEGDAAVYVYAAPRNATPAQLAKSARCLRYQCCEGNVPETWDTYKFLDQMCEAMGEPAGYDAADWDRERDTAA